MLVALRLVLVAIARLSGCSGEPWNSPDPAGAARQNVLYASFMERPKHLDPVQSYSENEYALIANIYQPPLQYHYFKRPYELVPFAATEVPRPRYYDAKGRELPERADAKEVAYSDYVIHIRPGMRYQPHPAFARDAQGRYVYRDLKAADLDRLHEIGDFRQTGTREVVAADYVHQLKRLAHPRLHSPIMQLMGEYIVGLKELGEELAKAAKGMPEDAFLDLTAYPLPGAEVIDAHTYRIRVHGKYPQFVYWLAMPFFAPVPPESDRFYAQPG